MLKQMLPLVGLFLAGSSGLRAQSATFIVPLPVVQSIQLSTGVTLQYVEQGDKTGVPVILLHGFTDSWRSWELVLPQLPASRHVFAITQRGHGRSGKPASGYDPQDLVRDVVAFLDQKKIRAAVIVGHSMGSVVAQRMAIDHPARTLGLVLVGTFADLRSNEAVQGFGQVLDTLQDPIAEPFAAEFQQSTLANPIDPAYLRTVIGESLQVPARVWKAIGASLFKVDYTEGLRGYAKPVLIVWGDKDVFSPRKDQDQLTAAMKGARLLVYTGTGHAVHWEFPARFAADLSQFVSEVKPAKQ